MNRISLEDKPADNYTHFERETYFTDISDKEEHNLFNKSDYASLSTVHRSKTTIKQKQGKSRSTKSHSVNNFTNQFTRRVVSPWRYPFPVKKDKVVKSSIYRIHSANKTEKVAHSMRKESTLTNTTMNSSLSFSLLKRFINIGIDVQQLPVYSVVSPVPRKFHRHCIFGCFGQE